jgi:hypothetical protein
MRRAICPSFPGKALVRRAALANTMPYDNSPEASARHHRRAALLTRAESFELEDFHSEGNAE